MSICLHPSRIAECLVVAVPGPDLDVASAEPLRARLADLGERSSPVLDLSAVTFMDCAGLSSLVGALNRFGDRLALRGVGPQVRRMLELTGLDGRFHVSGTGSLTGEVP